MLGHLIHDLRQLALLGWHQLRAHRDTLLQRVQRILSKPQLARTGERACVLDARVNTHG